MNLLYYVRHGQSTYNARRRFAGQTDVPLTSLGRIQAIAAGKKLKADNVYFDAILSSPLTRAYDTAVAIASVLEYPLHRIQIMPELKERSLGILEGQRNPLVIIEYALDEASIDHYEGVESLAELQKRADAFLSALEAVKADSILVVGHGAFGRAFRRSVLKLPLNHRGHWMRNAGITKLIG